MKKILFPTDFSPAADNAFIYALELAKATGASIVTLHTYEVPDLRRSSLQHTLAVFYESLNLEEFENYKDNIPSLRKIAEEQNLADVEVYHTLHEGQAETSIVRQAKEEGVDLIVMGTTGATGAKEIFLGSVAGEVMENAPCPVLGVPAEARFDGRLDHLVFTTTYAEEEKKALRWLVDWSKLFPAHIHCLHVDLSHTEDLTHNMDAFRNEFSSLGKLSFAVVDGNDFEPAVTDFLAATKADALAMVTHKRNFFQELFSYSRTKKMMYHLKTPVMSLPAALFAE